MQKKLAVRFAKLSSESQKIRSTNNISVSYEHQPKDPQERHHGILFGVLNIGADSKKSEELIELILDTFHGEYYQDITKPSLESFENALAKINEELSEYTNAGNTYWMGKMNAILGVFSGNVLHLSQNGKSECYLYRGGKDSHISEDLSGDGINPARTFVNITTGEISDGDKIATFTPGVLSSCSPAEIGKFVMNYHPKVAVNHIADIIQGVGGSQGQNAILIMEFMTPEAMANETLEDEPEEIWLEGQTKKEVIAEQAGSIFQRAIKFLAGIFGALAIIFGQKLIPFVKSFGSKTKNLSRKDSSLSKKEDDENIFLDTHEELNVAEDNVNFESHQQMSIDEVKKPEFKSEIRIKESDELGRFSVIGKTKDKVVDKINMVLDFIFRQRKIKKGKSLLKIKKTYLIAAAIILVAFSVPYGIYVRGIQQDKKQKTTELQKIENIASEITLADSEKDPKKAVEILSRASSLASGLTESKFVSDDAKKQLAVIEEKIKTITKTKDASPVTFTEISSNTNMAGFNSIEADFYAFNEKGEGFKIDRKTQKASQIQVSGKPDSKILWSASLSRIRTVELLSENGVFEFDTDTNELAAKAVSGESWPKGTKIESYGTNLYILSENQIYKHLRTAGGYAKGVGYFPSTEGRKIKSFTIDSDIYLLTDEGNIEKYTAGTKQDFIIKDLPIDLSKYNDIYTNEDTSMLFLTNKDDGSIVVIDKDGEYKGRYTSSDFKNAKSLYVESGIVYICLEKKIVTFELK